MPTLSLFRRVIRRLTGWPLIRMTYSAHYRAMYDAHHYIVKLIEDNEDGEARRAIEAEILRWIAAHKLQERPPVEATVNRETEAPKALARITAWSRSSHEIAEQSHVG
jgi:hypothetical protein